MSLVELLTEAAGRFAHKPALIDGSTTASYAGLLDQIDALRRQLEPLRLAPGSRVGILFPNSIQYVALTFALWQSQAVVVPVPVEYTEEDIDEITRSMELGGLLSQQPRRGSTLLALELHFTSFELPAPAHNQGLNVAFIRFT